MMEIDYSKLPTYQQNQLARYIERGGEVRNFIYAVLTNDLSRAIFHANKNDIGHLKDLAEFLYWEAPKECWGSPEKVKAWIENGGTGEDL